MTILLLIALLLAIFGSLLLARGRRGVVIDDHPLCGRCGFDLFGKPADVHVCSECGADLSQPKAVRVGHRRRRPGLMWSGGTLLVLGLVGGGAMLWATTSTVNWQQYKPTWWLVREIDSFDRTARDAALAELAARLTGGKLSDAQILMLADRALALQGDRSKTWLTGYGDLIESAWQAKKLPEDRWQKYLAQAPDFYLEPRPEVRSGDGMPYWVRHRPARVGARSWIYTRFSDQKWRMDDHPIERKNFSGGGSQLSASGSGGTGSTLDAKVFPEKLAPGKHELKLDMKVDLYPNSNESGAPMATTTLALKAPFNLVPASQPTVAVVKDPSLRGRVEKALKLNEMGITVDGTSGANDTYLNLTVHVDNLPVGVGYDVYVRAGGKESKAGSFAAPPGKRNHGYGFGGASVDLTTETVDLIFRPSVKAALGTTDTFEVWDGEIVMKDVKVNYPAKAPKAPAPATTAPATTAPATTAPATTAP